MIILAHTTILESLFPPPTHPRTTHTRHIHTMIVYLLWLSLRLIKGRVFFVPQDCSLFCVFYTFFLPHCIMYKHIIYNIQTYIPEYLISIGQKFKTEVTYVYTETVTDSTSWTLFLSLYLSSCFIQFNSIVFI